MTNFDIAIIVFIVASGLFAFVRGFIREVLSIIAWFGAAVAALYAIPYLRPFAFRFTSNEQLADAAVAFVAFVVALIILSLITAAIANLVKDSPAGGLDRMLGFIFGLARGFLLACLIYAAMAVVMPALNASPSWWTQSRTAPWLQAGLAALAQLAPHPSHSQTGTSSVTREFQDALHNLTNPKAAPEPQGAPNYSPQEQHDLNRLFQQNQSAH